MNDKKDNYRFGVDFVECVKIVRFKIGNNVTQDDICILFMSNLKKCSNYGNLDICLY